VLAAATEGIPRTINPLASAAWIEAAKENSLQIYASHLESALELVPGVMQMRQNSSPHDRVRHRKLAPVRARTPQNLLPLDCSKFNFALRSWAALV